jgi:hypothetical protein
VKKARADSALAGSITGRSPKATNWSSFYDSANGSRHPGVWPSLLRRSWEMRHGQTYPYPHGQDNWLLRPSDARGGENSS